MFRRQAMLSGVVFLPLGCLVRLICAPNSLTTSAVQRVVTRLPRAFEPYQEFLHV